MSFLTTKQNPLVGGVRAPISVDPNSGFIFTTFESPTSHPGANRIRGLATQKDTPHLVRSGGCNTLATSYFRRPYRPTIIGATVFHFRVRNGNGWDHCAMITRLGTALRAIPESNDRESNSQATAYRIEQILYKPSERTELEMEQCKTNR